MTIEKMMTPVGRLVWGNPSRSTVKKNQTTKQPVLREGKPIEQWAFGVAFPKQEFLAKVMPYLQQEAMSAYPHGVPAGFSWKFKDGDGVDRLGKPFNTREGYAGCFVLNVSTEAFAPPIYKFENGAYRQISPEEIKCGDYVALNLNVKVNVPTQPTHTPGLYVNPNGIELVGYGPEIRNSANPDELFGGVQHQLPPGASNVPLSSGAPMPGMPPAMGGYAPQPAAYAPPPPAAPQYNPAPGYAPAPQQYAPAPQQYAPAPQQYAPAPAAPIPPPAHDFVRNAGYPPAAPPQPAAYAPPPPAAPQYGPTPGYAPAPQPTMGNAYAGHAAAPQTYASPHAVTPAGNAPAAMTYPSNMPGMPQGR